MGLIRSLPGFGTFQLNRLSITVTLFVSFFAFFPHTPLAAQSPLAGEIQTLKDRLAVQSVSVAERAAALRRLARLEVLAGDIEAAAGSWNSAAFANPGGPDYASLLESVRCYIALGDYPAADGAVQIVLNRAALPALLREGQYLLAVSGALRSGDGTALASLFEAPEYANKKPAMLYLLWTLSGWEEYRARLKREFPASPESLILEQNPAASVSAAARPMWLLFAGREGVTVGEVSRPAPPVSSPPEAAGRDAGAGEDGAPALLQTGLFSREENAGTMAARLRAAGFTPVLRRREVNGNSFYVVGVAPGNAINEMILRLKDAGFEAFPVYGAF
jgi:cell division septation protein DedD